MRAIMEAGGFAKPPNAALLSEWKAAGAHFEKDIIPIIRREARSLRERTGEAPRTLTVFNDAVMGKLAADEAEIERLRRIRRRMEQADLEQSQGSRP